MKKCVRITLELSEGRDILESQIKRYARNVGVEGIAYHTQGDEYEIIVNGEKENVEKFIDKAHEAVIQAGSEEFLVEPATKEEDFRGVFRVLQ